MRKLASIRLVNNVFPIDNADSLEAVQVGGWVCVTQKNLFKPGDVGIYFEIDSFLPASDSRFSFLEKQFIHFNEKKGARLRTIRLRGQLSQGLFLPVTKFPEVENMPVGSDVTEILGIEKWEPFIPAQLAGEVVGTYPYFIPTSDQERIQNLDNELSENQGQEFEVTIKLDGSSMTVYRNDKALDKNGSIRQGVCSRNWELRETAGNSLWRVTRKNGILEALEYLGRNLAFQGEIIGNGIQGNPEKLSGQEFYVYNIYDIDSSKYLSPDQRMDILKDLNDNGFKISHVPVEPTLVLNHTMEEILAMADGTSLNPTQKREGLVFKRKDGLFSFKAISNWYLEKHKDR